MRSCVRVLISGRVQGVGFRYWAQGEARQRGLNGWVRNCVDGAVAAVFEGPSGAVDGMLRACNQGPRFAKVEQVEVSVQDEPVETGFHIKPTTW